MKIDISQLLKSIGNELGVEETESLTFKEDDLILTAPVNIKINLVNTGETVLVKGVIRTKVRLECCRCLKEFDLPLRFEIEEEYSKKTVKKHQSSKNNDLELYNEDLISPISEDNKIDLTEAIRQNIFTALPIKPLCNYSCKGFNGGVTKQRMLDPRLSYLEEIKKEIQGG